MSGLTNFLLPNEPTCIVACSAGSARFWFSESRFGDWQLLEEIQDKQAGRREADLASDRPGRAFDSVGGGRHAMASKSTAQQRQKLLFARRVAGYLNEAVAESLVRKLVILAGPGMLGYLRSELSDAALQAVILSEPVNLANLQEEKIRKYFE